MVSTNFDERWKIFSAFKVECPPVWATNNLERLPQYNLKKFKSVSQYLQRRMGQKEFSLPSYVKPKTESLEDEMEDDDDESDEDFEIEGGTGAVPEPLDPAGQYGCLVEVGSEDWICTKICVGSLALLLNLQGSHWGNCRVALRKNPEKCSASHIKVYQYFLNATSLCKQFLLLKTGTGRGTNKREEEERLNRSILKMKNTWKSVENSAVVHFVRGRLAAIMGLSHDTSLTHYRKAALLEPENAMWQQMLYEKLKQMRSSGSGHSHSNHPGREELAACQKALELSPGNVKVMVDLATVKLQSLNARANDATGGQTSAKDAAVIEKLLREVLKLAPSNSRYEMMARLKTGELYTARGLPQRTLEAKNIFLECYKKWPKSSMVLHKVAKFYHYNCNDYAQAKKVYEEAMQVAPANFPCLMDYLKLYGRFLKKYGEMVTIIDRSLPLIKESEHIVKLLIIKGQAYWLLGQGTRKDACDVWLEAFMNFEWLGSKVKDALTSPKPTPEFGKVDISLAELRPLFLKACEKQKVDMSRNKSVKEFIAVLQNAEQQAHSSRRPRDNIPGGSNAARITSSRNDNTLYKHFLQAMEMKPKQGRRK